MIRDRRYAIHLYADEPLKSTDPTHDTVLGKAQKAVELLRCVQEEYGADSIAVQALYELINDHTWDHMTGALTSFGHAFTSLRRGPVQLPPEYEHFNVFIDANDMHYWNEHGGTTDASGKIILCGTEDVDRHLKAIGYALVHGARMERKDADNDHPQFRPSLDLVARRSVTRTHGSAGDEFVVDLYCPRVNVVNVVERLFDRVYAEQAKLYALGTFALKTA